MEPVADVATINNPPRPLTVQLWVARKVYKRTGLIPRIFQVNFGLAVDAGHDVLCVSSTGSGKSFAFVIIHYFREHVITWIVSPLNVIENQMAKTYTAQGVSAVAVNAATCTPGLLKV